MAYNPGISYRGDQHLAQGIANAGQSIAQGVSQQGERSEARKRYGKILEGMGSDKDAIADMSLADMQGTIEAQAMQFADRKQQAQIEQLEAQNRYFQQEMAAAAQARGSENQFQTQLRQYGQGVGGGVLSPEVQERYQLARQNPAVAASADTGMPLEVAQRYFPQTQADGFSPDQMGQARPIPGADGQFFVPTSKGGGQIVSTRQSSGPALRETRLFQAMSEAREAGNTEAAQFYSDLMDKMIEGETLDASTQRMLAITNPEMLKELMQMNQRGSRGAASPAAPKAEPKPDPAQAKKNVMGRLFGN